jgi:hypothetical protein
MKKIEIFLTFFLVDLIFSSDESKPINFSVELESKQKARAKGEKLRKANQRYTLVNGKLQINPDYTEKK